MGISQWSSTSGKHNGVVLSLAFLANQFQISAYDPKRSPRTLLARASSPNRIEPKTLVEQARLHMTVCPSPRPVPTTTSDLIGWRTADKNCSLEKYGKYARGQESLHRKFKWPVEGFD